MTATTVDSRPELLRSRLHALGFDDVRFAAVGAPGGDQQSLRGLRGWLTAGLQADMHWMERTVDKRLDPTLVLPGAQSMIMLGVSYWREQLRQPALEGEARWARYALYEDYHDTMKPGLVAAGHVLEELYGVAGTDYRYYVDTGPVIDRGWAARAGIGFIGKNAMLISRNHGNWLFLAAIITRVGLPPDAPIRRTLPPRSDRPLPTGTAIPAIANERAREGALAVSAAAPSSIPAVGLLCGKCTRCLDACPTDAFAAPGVVDARRCISYQTIENKGVIPRELRAGIGDRIYGCDICLEVCPWNRFAQQGRQLLLAARDDLAELSLREILELTPERFAEVFRGTPIKRLKLGGLLRNACVVAGNRGDAVLLPRLVALATAHPLPMVRAHAVWAVHRLAGGELLTAARATEIDPLVHAEYLAESTAAPEARQA